MVNFPKTNKCNFLSKLIVSELKKCNQYHQMTRIKDVDKCLLHL